MNVHNRMLHASTQALTVQWSCCDEGHSMRHGTVPRAALVLACRKNHVNSGIALQF